eukprot:Blabericola_migrator_1__12845@NODE_832_length_6348_cov_238_992039_g587_i0_p7_GENE_NODE_832_length_6348_cov_238_992039_g587_i0NODE_832_length_6348_cov_238_992039_g587_i0_p7_ORF_typecomplete_len153_score22_11TMEM52/PF14979_6/0_43_NODE_832_length_6348_cov_238_992039_g587_i049375395
MLMSLLLRCCCISKRRKESTQIKGTLKFEPRVSKSDDGADETNSNPVPSVTVVATARERAESLIYTEFMSHIEESGLVVTRDLSQALGSSLDELVTELPHYEKIVAEFSRRPSQQDLQHARTLAKHLVMLSVNKARRKDSLSSIVSERSSLL